MIKRSVAAIFLLAVVSCNSNTADNKPAENKQQVENSSTGNSNQAQIEELNKQSMKCIALMNRLEEDQAAAQKTGDATAVAALQNSIDSAATENSKIGQKLMELQGK